MATTRLLVLPENVVDIAGGLRLAAAGPDGADRDHRLPGLEHGGLVAHQHEVGPLGVDQGGHRHHVGIGDVAVGENNLVDVVLLDQLGDAGLLEDGDSLGIEPAGQGGRILAARDVGDLRGSEGDDLVVGVVAEVGVEVVEIPSRRARDDHFLSGHVVDSTVAKPQAVVVSS